VIESFNIEYWFLSYLFILPSWGSNHFCTTAWPTAAGWRRTARKRVRATGSPLEQYK